MNCVDLDVASPSDARTDGLPQRPFDVEEQERLDQVLRRCLRHDRRAHALLGPMAATLRAA